MMPLANCRILVAEDDLALLEVICRMLERKGAAVKKAVNGAEALELFKTQAFDLILSDIQMPLLTGVELLTEVRKQDPKIPVFLLATGQADISEAQSRNMGAAALLRKPFRFTELLPIIIKSLEK